VTDTMAGRHSHLPPLLLYHFAMELGRNMSGSPRP